MKNLFRALFGQKQSEPDPAPSITIGETVYGDGKRVYTLTVNDQRRWKEWDTLADVEAEALNVWKQWEKRQVISKRTIIFSPDEDSTSP